MPQYGRMTIYIYNKVYLITWQDIEANRNMYTVYRTYN